MPKDQRTTTPKVLVIIPAYNEEKTIIPVATSVMNLGYDVVVVNDGSHDATRCLCEKHNIPILNLPYNLGIGGAVQTGHKYAYLKDYDIDIQFDGDGQHDETYIPALIEAIQEGSDLVIGSRFIEEKTKGAQAQAQNFRSTKLRRVGIRWLSFWIKLFSKQRVYDPTSGFRAAGKKAIRLFAEDYPSDYPEPESIVDASKKSLKISEVPVQMKERKEGTSSIGGLGSIYYMMKVSLEIAIIAVFKHKERW